MEDKNVHSGFDRHNDIHSWFVLFFDIMRILGPVLLIATLIFLLFILDYIF